MSGSGTFRTCRAHGPMSVLEGKAEKARDDRQAIAHAAAQSNQPWRLNHNKGSTPLAITARQASG
jgi:hypothetical protein